MLLPALYISYSHLPSYDQLLYISYSHLSSYDQLVLTTGGSLAQAQDRPAIEKLQSVLLAKLQNEKLRTLLLHKQQNWQVGKAAHPEKIVCPKGVKMATGVDVSSYTSRNLQGGCYSNRGLWQEDVMCAELMKLLSVGILLGYQAGDHAFDWGAGCGHMLWWLEQTFGLKISGHEHTEGSVQVWWHPQQPPASS